MKITKTLMLALSVSIASLSSVAQAADKITIATEGAWAPFNFIDSNGEPQGFDVDIAKALCVKMQRECDIVTLDFDGLIPGLIVKKYDAISASISITEERMKQVDFTHPIYSGGLRFMAAKDKTFDTARSALKGKNIGAQRSTIAAKYLEDYLSDVVNIKLYGNNDNVYLDLQSGRLDGALSDELPTYDWLKSEGGQNFEFKGEAFAKDDKIAIVVRKGNDELKDGFNKALKQIIDDGTYAKINAKYFPFSIY